VNLPLKLPVGEDGGGLQDGDSSLRGGDGGLGQSFGAGRMATVVGASEWGGWWPAKEPRCGEADVRRPASEGRGLPPDPVVEAIEGGEGTVLLLESPP